MEPRCSSTTRHVEQLTLSTGCSEAIHQASQSSGRVPQPDSVSSSSLEGNKEALTAKSSFLLGQQLPCKVCLSESKPTGLHYGVMTCDACKVFYKRYSVLPEAEMPECRQKPPNRCVSRGKKFLCVSCRFQKCVAEGMCKEAMKRGRYKMELKQQVIRAQNEHKQNRTLSQGLKTVEQSSVSEPENHQLSVQNLLEPAQPDQVQGGDTEGLQPQHERMLMKMKETVTRIFSTYLFGYDPALNPQASEVVEHLQQAYGESSESVSMAQFSTVEDSCQIINTDADNATDMVVTAPFMNQIDQHAVEVTQFAKNIPGFTALDIQNQLVLIKTAVFQIILLLRCYLSDPDSKVTYRVYTKQGRLVMYPIQLFREMNIPEEDMEVFMKFAQRIWDLRLTLEQIGLLIGIIICNPDQPKISQAAEIDEFRQNLIAIAEYSFKTSHPEEPKRWGNFLLLLPTLHEISVDFTNFLIKCGENENSAPMGPFVTDVVDQKGATN